MDQGPVASAAVLFMAAGDPTFAVHPSVSGVSHGVNKDGPMSTHRCPVDQAPVVSLVLECSTFLLFDGAPTIVPVSQGSMLLVSTLDGLPVEISGWSNRWTNCC